MKICLVTTSQPAANPRLVKEADALVDAGHSVRVVAAHWAYWAHPFDAELCATRRWRCDLLDWRREVSPTLFWRTRIRHFVARHVAPLPFLEPLVEESALSRIGPNLRRLVFTEPADLFIAHNLGALPVALAAGRRFGAPVGFDAEDFHSGQLSHPHDRRLAAVTRAAECRWLPQCAYVTAAAPAIAEAYRDLCRIPLPVSILNVFPLSERPARFRRSDRDGPIRLYWFSQTIGPGRGLEDAVQAMGMLRSYPLELHLRGRWQAGYEERLRRLGQEHGLENQQIVSYPPAPPWELVQLASEYDIGLAVEPPVSVNSDILLSNKIFSYLLAGNAVLATATRGQVWLASQLDEAVSLTAHGRPDSLAEGLRPWLDDRSRLDAARKRAWCLGESRFNWELERRIFLDLVARSVAVA